MPSRLFVGNLPYEATEDEIREHFSQVAPVSRVFMPLDRDTGKPRGFAFVEFAEPEQSSAAIEQLHQKPFKDRPLVVNEARPSEGRPSGPPRGARPAGGGAPPRPQSRERTSMGGAPDGAPARPSPSRPRRRGGKRSFWDDSPKKEPIPEKVRGQILSGYDDDVEDEEEIEFENFATSLPEIDEEE